MQSIKMKPLLFKLHRWVGLVLTPLFLVIALSGAVLAFKPMLVADKAVADPGEMPPVVISEVVALIERLDPTGNQISGLRIDSQHNRLSAQSKQAALQGDYDLSSGVRLSSSVEKRSFDLFSFAERLHKELLLGAGFLVELAAYLMLFMIVVAPFLAWPRLKHSLSGWHRSVGWLLLPLLFMLPATGVFMSLHIGMPELPEMSARNARLPLSQALRLAAEGHDLTDLTQARRFRGGSVMLSTGSGEDQRSLVVTDTAVTSIDPGGYLIKTLHEGTWAGAWSGSLNLLGGIALGTLSLTGLLSWSRRSRKRRRSQARVLTT